eukprot:4080734-Prorocentrum_lima.AAC.1
MTSSLVGSEMCIRDSCRPQKLAAGGVGGHLALGGQQRARRVDLEGRAVSYTHLTLPTICSV